MKKILCMCLALCMLVLAVPAMAWPVAAAPAVVTSSLQKEGKLTRPAIPKTWADWQKENPTGTQEQFIDYLAAVEPYTYSGDWKCGVVSLQDGSFSPILYTQVMAAKTYDQTWDVQWGVTEKAYKAAIASLRGGKAGNSPWASGYGAMYLNTSAPMTAVQPSTIGEVYAMVYTATASGTAAFSYEDIQMVEGGNCLCICVDGMPVFPANASLGDRTTWYSGQMTADAVNAQLSALSVQVLQGAEIWFCVTRNTNWTSVATYNGAAVGCAPAVTITVDSTLQNAHTVRYLGNNGLPRARFVVADGTALPSDPGATDMTMGYDLDGDGKADTLPATVQKDLDLVAIEIASGKDKFAENMPTRDGDRVAFSGNWKIVHGHWDRDIATLAEGVQPTWSWSKETGLIDRVNTSGIFVSSEAGLWDANGGGMYSYGKFAVRTTASCTANGVLYTAPATGFVTLDFSRLAATREVNAGTTTEAPISYYFAILMNGKVVWPSSGQPWHYEGDTVYNNDTLRTEEILEKARAVEAFPTLLLQQGDEVAFVANMGNSTSYMCYLAPTVEYIGLAQGVTCTGLGTSLGESFSLQYYLKADTGAKEVGILYQGKKILGEKQADGTYLATLPGIAAKQMTDSFSVEPYQVVEKAGATYTMYATRQTASLRQVLLAEIEQHPGTVAEVARAALYYGAAAQTYFDYYADTLANEGVTAPTVTPAAYADVYALTGEGGQVSFTASTVLLEDTVAWKILLKNGAGCTVQLSRTADFATATTADVVSCGAGSSPDQYKAIFHGIPYADYGTTLYARVLDASGQVVSPLRQVLLAEIEQHPGTVAEVARAALYYGAAAQTYFDYYADTLANEGVTAPTVTPAAYADVYALTGEGGQVSFTASTVLLEDTVAWKILLKNGAGCTVQLSRTADFATATTADVVSCGAGSSPDQYKAIFHGIPYADYGTTLYARVLDASGQVVSPTLTYSIASYACRTAQVTDVKAVTDALATLCAALDAYRA